MAWSRNAPPNGGTKPKYEHKVNHGSVFDNDRKTEERHADLTGSANIDGVLYWVNAWMGTTQQGKRKLGLTFKRKDELGARGAEPSEARPMATASRSSKW